MNGTVLCARVIENQQSFLEMVATQMQFVEGSFQSSPLQTVIHIMIQVYPSVIYIYLYYIMDRYLNSHFFKQLHNGHISFISKFWDMYRFPFASCCNPFPVLINGLHSACRNRNENSEVGHFQTLHGGSQRFTLQRVLSNQIISWKGVELIEWLGPGHSIQWKFSRQV